MAMTVRTLCLGVLSRAPASGYEIRKQCEEGPYRCFFDAGFSSIYPALRRLSEEGLIIGEEHAQVSKPDKVVYRLTGLGWSEFLNSLTEIPGPDRLKSDFVFMMFFADHIEAEHLAEVIESRLAWYRTELARMRKCQSEMGQSDLAASQDKPLGEAFALGYGLAVYQAAETYLLQARDALIGAVAARQRQTPTADAAE